MRAVFIGTKSPCAVAFKSFVAKWYVGGREYLYCGMFVRGYDFPTSGVDMISHAVALIVLFTKRANLAGKCYFSVLRGTRLVARFGVMITEDDLGMEVFMELEYC